MPATKLAFPVFTELCLGVRSTIVWSKVQQAMWQDSKVLTYVQSVLHCGFDVRTRKITAEDQFNTSVDVRSAAQGSDRLIRRNRSFRAREICCTWSTHSGGDGTTCSDRSATVVSTMSRISGRKSPQSSLFCSRVFGALFGRGGRLASACCARLALSGRAGFPLSMRSGRSSTA